MRLVTYGSNRGTRAGALAGDGVVDVWDALRSDRPYRKAWSIEKAREYIREQAGIYFDPQIVEYFLEIRNT